MFILSLIVLNILLVLLICEFKTNSNKETKVVTSLLVLISILVSIVLYFVEK